MGFPRLRVGFVLLTSFLLIGCAKAGAESGSATTAPIDATRMEEADRIIEEAIARKGIPGGVLLVERGGKTVYLKAYGNRSVQVATATVPPAVTSMTTDAIFDMASLSKPMGCATSIMILAERGKLKISDPVAKYIPAFGVNGKEKITIEDLLLHRGHLIPDNDIEDYKDGPAVAWEK
ncbi:MAG TPA: serine hydrolase domain-containing protein, partial [Tepidisphaeraceae bacterium]|nr:serine hydrolase domain-containing protein [Tepidisphaeraceae bacterium]